MSRTSQSVKNIVTGIGSQIFLAAVSFFTTRIIKVSLGFEYLGLNGVFNNIMSLLGLTELGIGGAIVFALYKPLAENDTKLISILMRFYRNAYCIIGSVVFVIGMAIMPFLQFFVHTTLSLNYVRGVFLLFVFNSSASYFLSYKRNLIFADQKNYIITLYTLIFSLISKVGQLTVFLVTKSYVLYLSVNILCTILLNILISLKANRLYPYLKDKVTEKMPLETKNMLVSKIKALFLHSIGDFVVFGTDNILISHFLGVAEVGRYSSYMMIVSLIGNLVNQIYTGISSSVGNFLVLKSKEEQYELYKKIEFINSVLLIFISVCLATLLTPFVSWWLGEDSVLSKTVVYLIVASNFIGYSRTPIGTIKTAVGIFEKDKFAPLIESLINLVSSIVLAHFIGLPGIIIGTIISSLAVPFWVQSTIVYKDVFQKNPISYFLVVLRNFVCSAALIAPLQFLFGRLFVVNKTVSLLLYFFIAIVSCAVFEFAVFFKSKYFKFFCENAKNSLQARKLNKAREEISLDAQ